MTVFKVLVHEDFLWNHFGKLHDFPNKERTITATAILALGV